MRDNLGHVEYRRDPECLLQELNRLLLPANIPTSMHVTDLQLSRQMLFPPPESHNISGDLY